MCNYSDYSDFWKFVFHKVVWLRSLGVVGYLVIALLQIFDRIYHWRNFENPSIFVKVRANDKVGRFFWDTVYMRFRLVPKSTTLDYPELILNVCYVLCCITKLTTKIWMKIDPYYQGQKCSPGIAVSSKIWFMRIFAGVRWWGGFKWEWDRRISLILPYISSELLYVRPQLLYYAM